MGETDPDPIESMAYAVGNVSTVYDFELSRRRLRKFFSAETIAASARLAETLIRSSRGRGGRPEALAQMDHLLRSICEDLGVPEEGVREQLSLPPLRGSKEALDRAAAAAALAAILAEGSAPELVAALRALFDLKD